MSAPHPTTAVTPASASSADPVVNPLATTPATAARQAAITRRGRYALLAGLALLVAAPFIGLYPVFMMKALCFAIFACAFNLLLGYTGVLSFGHAA